MSEHNTTQQACPCDCGHESDSLITKEQSCPCDPCECDPCECVDCDTSSYTSDEETDTDTDTDSDDEDLPEDLDDEHSCILRGKWMYDGSKTIDDMIAALQREITLLTDLKNDGWVVEHEVQDDYAYLVKEETTTDN